VGGLDRLNRRTPQAQNGHFMVRILHVNSLTWTSFLQVRELHNQRSGQRGAPDRG
jgi:hypothetical protein